jgi:cell division protein FtsB
MRKRMYFIPAGCIAFILYFTVFGERGLLHIYHLHKEKQEIQLRVEAMKIDNQKLVREIDALKNDRRYLESIARKEFGLVRHNEVIYQFPAATRAQDQPAPIHKAVSTSRGRRQ